MFEDATSTLSGYVERMNKFLYKADFTDEADLQALIERVAAETGLTTGKITAVMESTLTIMEERRAAAGVDNDKIGEGYAYGLHIVTKRNLIPRWRLRR